MKIEAIFCDNYFPPTVIEIIKLEEHLYETRTDYRVPSDGKYGKNTIGIWHVKYKKLNPNYYCEGQKNN